MTRAYWFLAGAVLLAVLFWGGTDAPRLRHPRDQWYI